MDFGDKMDNNRICSFCGKREAQVQKMIAAHNVCICDECIDLCNEMISEDLKRNQKAILDVNELPKPKEIKAILDE